MWPARQKRIIGRGCRHGDGIGAGGVAKAPPIHDAQNDGTGFGGRLHRQAAFMFMAADRSATTVIGMAGQNHHRAIQLLCQHRPKQHMRPGGAAKGDSGLRPVQNPVGMAIGAANGKIGGCHALVAIAFQHRRKRFG